MPAGVLRSIELEEQVGGFGLKGDVAHLVHDEQWDAR
jgi:hypothetical protein